MVPLPGEYPAHPARLYDRLLALVAAAECAARRLLIIMATALASQPSAAIVARRTAHHTDPETEPSPLSPPLLDLTGLFRGGPAKPDLFPLTEPGRAITPTSPRQPAGSQRETGSEPSAPTHHEPAPDWTSLMLRLSRLRRLIHDPMPSAIRMRALLDQGPPPVPLQQVPALTSPLLDSDARALAGFVSAIALDAVYPSGVPPDCR